MRFDARLVLALAWGALPAAILALVALTLAAPALPRAALYVGLAPLVEEALKAVGVAWARPRGARDGALAGALAGLGFGLAEAFFRAVLGEARLAAVLLHVVASALVGLAWAGRAQRLRAAALAGAAVALHAAFNARALGLV